MPAVCQCCRQVDLDFATTSRRVLRHARCSPTRPLTYTSPLHPSLPASDRPERRWQARNSDSHARRPPAPAGAPTLWRWIRKGRGARWTRRCQENGDGLAVCWAGCGGRLLCCFGSCSQTAPHYCSWAPRRCSSLQLLCSCWRRRRWMPAVSHLSCLPITLLVLLPPPYHTPAAAAGRGGSRRERPHAYRSDALWLPHPSCYGACACTSQAGMCVCGGGRGDGGGGGMLAAWWCFPSTGTPAWVAAASPNFPRHCLTGWNHHSALQLSLSAGRGSAGTDDLRMVCLPTLLPQPWPLPIAILTCTLPL